MLSKERRHERDIEITRGYSFVIFSSVFNEVCLKCDILVPHKIRWLQWKVLEKNPFPPLKTIEDWQKNQQNLDENHSREFQWATAKTVYFASRDLTLHKTSVQAVMKRINLFRRVSGKTVSTFHSNERNKTYFKLRLRDVFRGVEWGL